MVCRWGSRKIGRRWRRKLECGDHSTGLYYHTNRQLEFEVKTPKEKKEVPERVRRLRKKRLRED
jgi:hypothetical protein